LAERVGRYLDHDAAANAPRLRSMTFSVPVGVSGSPRKVRLFVALRAACAPGGQAGAAAGNPAANNVRIIVEGTNDLITAFPFR
jgi:hypothetical protein